MANGDASGLVTWQKVAVGLASLLASGFMLLEKDTIDHMGRLDDAMTNQASALNKMAGSLDQLTISNNRFDTSLGKIYDRLHGLEEAQASALNKMAGSLDQLTISNNRFDSSLGKIYDRLHGLEEAQASALASVVTNEHDITMLRNEMVRHIEADNKGFKTLGVTPP